MTYLNTLPQIQIPNGPHNTRWVDVVATNDHTITVRLIGAGNVTLPRSLATPSSTS